MAKKRGKNWEKNAAERQKRGSIKTQIVRNLYTQHQRGRGTSKKADKESGRGYSGKIYSDVTYKNYCNANAQAVDWMKAQGMNPKDIAQFERQMPQYLNHLIEHNYSPYTVHLHASAAAKLYDGKSTDFGVKLPPRRPSERVHNNNTEKARASLLARERDLLDVVRCTGLRRVELEAFSRANHMDFITGQTDVLHLNGRLDDTKGGRDRDIPLTHANAERVREHLRESARMQSERPFSNVHANLPVHLYRHYFAKDMYGRLLDEKYQRGEKTERWYRCRDGSGQKFDRDVAQRVSEALGHSRLDTTIVAYLR